MSHRHGDPDELREIAQALRDQRPALDPLALDRTKLRAMSRARRGRRAQRMHATLVRSPAMVLATVALLALGSGTAIAVCGGGGGPNPEGEGKNAGYKQYKNGCPPGYVQDSKEDCCVEEKGVKYDTQNDKSGSGGSQCCEGQSGGNSPLDEKGGSKGGGTECCTSQSGGNKDSPLDDKSGGDGSQCCEGGGDKNENTPNDDKGGGDDQQCCEGQTDSYSPLDEKGGSKGGGTECCTGQSGGDKNENTPNDDKGGGDDQCGTEEKGGKETGKGSGW